MRGELRTHNMAASESDLVFSKPMRILAPLIGFVLGIFLELYTGMVNNLIISNNLGGIITFFAVMVGLSGTIIAGVFGAGATLRKLGVYSDTWKSLLGYLGSAISLSIFGSVTTIIALAPLNIKQDTLWFAYIIAALAGAALLNWSLGIFAVITCGQIMFDRSEGPDSTPRTVISGQLGPNLERRMGPSTDYSGSNSIAEEGQILDRKSPRRKKRRSDAES